MSLNVTPVPRNLATKVTFLYLEFDDLFAILGLAVVMNMFGRFLQREMFGIHFRNEQRHGIEQAVVPRIADDQVAGLSKRRFDVTGH